MSRSVNAKKDPLVKINAVFHGWREFEVSCAPFTGPDADRLSFMRARFVHSQAGVIEALFEDLKTQYQAMGGQILRFPNSATAVKWDKNHLNDKLMFMHVIYIRKYLNFLLLNVEKSILH